MKVVETRYICDLCDSESYNDYFTTGKQNTLYGKGKITIKGVLGCEGAGQAFVEKESEVCFVCLQKIIDFLPTLRKP